MEVQVDFDEIRIGVVWSKDSYLLKFRTVTKLHTSGMPQGENITLKFGGFSWIYPAKSFIGSLGGVWVRGLVYQVFFIQAFGVFFCLFFRKRLTIQEALSHPWITVRLKKEKRSCFFS